MSLCVVFVSCSVMLYGVVFVFVFVVCLCVFKRVCISCLIYCVILDDLFVCACSLLCVVL